MKENQCIAATEEELRLCLSVCLFPFSTHRLTNSCCSAAQSGVSSLCTISITSDAFQGATEGGKRGSTSASWGTAARLLPRRRQGSHGSASEPAAGGR